jgi:hypothetical protein
VIYPPNGWRCRCRVETLSQAQFDKQGLTLSERAGVEQNVDPKFRFNPAKGPTGAQLTEIFTVAETKGLVGWERYGLAKELSTKRTVPAGTPPHPEYLRKQGLDLDEVVERYRADFKETWAGWDGQDFAGNGMTLSPDFFEHLVGLDTGNVTWDRVKRGRWSRAALEALKEPEEFWLSLHIDIVDGKEIRNLRRYYLATFTDEKDRLIAVFATVDPGTRAMIFNILPMTQVRQMNKQMRSGVLLWRDPKAGKGKP